MAYSFLSLVVACSWRRVWAHARGLGLDRAADVLFGLRIFPLIAAALTTASLAVPSFLLLEPRVIDEPIGGVSVALVVCGLTLGLVGSMSAIIALRRAARAVAEWTRGARVAGSADSVPVLTISPVSPAMTAAGIFRPRILLSGVAELQLTGSELQAALKHELAHVRRADNLKKLLMRFVTFPGMRGLEAAWLETTEMAADAAAVSTISGALDLATALIKLSRLAPQMAATALTAPLIHGRPSALHARVERLMGWSEEQCEAPVNHSLLYGLGLGLTATFGVIGITALTCSTLLVHIHMATEWLVR